MEKLVYYNDFIEGTAFCDFSGPPLGSSNKQRSFFNSNGIKCKYCHNKMSEIYNDKFENKGWSGFDYYHRSDVVKRCLNCDWWEYEHLYKYGSSEFIECFEKTICRGIIKKFEISDKKLPITLLNKEIKKRPHLLYKIDSRIFEIFVKDVFEDFYNCEVIHCGRTGDGGIDLLIINSDNPILVQVKRRTEKTAKQGESIKEVREFLGALLINQSKQGIYVTTAKKFSKNSIEIQKDILKKRIIKKFDLIDFNMLISIFKLNEKRIIDPWEKLIKQDKIFYKP